MSKIDDMIAKLCPNRTVTWATLDEVCTAISAGGDLPIKYKKGQSLPTDGFPYPIYSNGTGEGSLYGFTETYKIDSEAVTISARGTIGWHTIRHAKFTPIVRLISLLPDTKVISTKFLNYVLDITEIGHSGGSIPQLTVPNVKKIRIPIPPLVIQQEIVDILDKFTKLEAELEAELEARNKQYSYYRDKLLSFDDNMAGVSWKTMGEVANIYDGTHQTPKYISEGVKFASVENIKFPYDTKKPISHEDYDKNYKIKPRKHDLFMTRIGSIGECTVIDRDEDIAYYVTLTLIRPNLNIVSSKYLKFIIESGHGKSELRKRTLTMATPIIINLGEIGKIKIPVPPISEQNRIVSILDKFDALVSDISEGLPAEIAARRKQYEHYRNRLLTFNEIA